MKTTIDSFRRDGTAFKAVDGNWYSVRDTDLRDNFQRGDEVEFEFTTREWKGRNFHNINDDKVTKLSAAAAVAPSAKGPLVNKRWHAYEDQAYQGDIQLRIGRQNALTNAVVANGPKAAKADLSVYVNNVLTTAEAFAKWTSGRAINDIVADVSPQNPAPAPKDAEKIDVPVVNDTPSPDFDDDITF